MINVSGLALGLFLILGLPNVTIAGPFTASYDFGGPATDGDTFTFDFIGMVSSVDSNLIEGVSALSNIQLGGIDVFLPGDMGPFGGPIIPFGDVLSFDGTANLFFALNPFVTDVIEFQEGTARVLSNAEFGPSGFLISESFDPTRWSVLEPSVTARVPAPSPLLMFIGAGLVFCYRKVENRAQKSGEPARQACGR
ncbi:MAG: hypothetical protein AAGI88_21350 [Pseudomonadota bacterium]